MIWQMQFPGAFDRNHAFLLIFRCQCSHHREKGRLARLGIPYHNHAM